MKAVAVRGTDDRGGQGLAQGSPASRLWCGQWCIYHWAKRQPRRRWDSRAPGSGCSGPWWPVPTARWPRQGPRPAATKLFHIDIKNCQGGCLFAGKSLGKSEKFQTDKTLLKALFTLRRVLERQEQRLNSSRVRSSSFSLFVVVAGCVSMRLLFALLAMRGTRRFGPEIMNEANADEWV